MHYLDPVTYSKKILALMEDEMPAVEETIPVKGPMTIKERISNLLPEEKEKLKQYMEALKEIKKEVFDLLHKDAVKEVGGDMTGKILNPEE
jgi:hypothetical protein